jgi:hypothetical protein
MACYAMLRRRLENQIENSWEKIHRFCSSGTPPYFNVASVMDTSSTRLFCIPYPTPTAEVHRDPALTVIVRVESSVEVAISRIPHPDVPVVVAYWSGPTVR